MSGIKTKISISSKPKKVYPLKFPPELYSLYGECPKNMRGFDSGIYLGPNQGQLKK